MLLALIPNIRHGKLKQHESLKSYTLTIARLYSENVIRTRIKERTQIGDFDYLSFPEAKPTPERSVVERQQIERMKQVLAELPKKAREVLERFYLHEQTPEQICNETGLTATQFRLLKSRAKMRFGKLGKQEEAVRQNAEPRADPVCIGGRPYPPQAIHREPERDAAWSKTPRTSRNSMHENREICSGLSNRQPVREGAKP